MNDKIDEAFENLAKVIPTEINIKMTDYVSHLVEIMIFLLALNIGFTSWNIFLLLNH